MRRGTTPTLKFTTDQDWTGYSLLLTLEEDNLEMNFTNDRLTVEGSTVYITLTQDESLQFKKNVQAQLKGRKADKVIATDIVKIKVLPILHEEAL